MALTPFWGLLSCVGVSRPHGFPSTVRGLRSSRAFGTSACVAREADFKAPVGIKANLDFLMGKGQIRAPKQLCVLQNLQCRMEIHRGQGRGSTAAGSAGAKAREFGDSVVLAWVLGAARGRLTVMGFCLLCAGRSDSYGVFRSSVIRS